MFAANLVNALAVKAHLAALWMVQDQGDQVGWDIRSLWAQMAWPARIVVIILFIMSAWSIGVMIDRWIAFSAARKQSRQFAPAVAGALREGKLDEAIRVAERHKKSHLAKVVTAGLQEFKAPRRFHRDSRRTNRSQQARSGALRSHCSCRVEARTGRAGLHRLHVALCRSVWHGARYPSRPSRRSLKRHGSASLGQVAGGISEALVTTALGLAVAIPAVLMFQLFHRQSRSL